MNEQMNEEDRKIKQPQYISISEAESLTNIPNATLKRYILNHPNFINYIKAGREYRINLNDIDTLKRIRKLYNEGLKKDVVNTRLEESGVPVTITIDSEDAEGFEVVSVNEELTEIKEMMKWLAKKFEEDKQEILLKAEEDKRTLTAEITELKQLLNRRNADEVANLRKSLEDKKDDAEAREKEKKREQQEMFTKIEEATDKAIKDAINSYKEEVEGNKSWLQKLFGK